MKVDYESNYTALVEEIYTQNSIKHRYQRDYLEAISTTDDSKKNEPAQDGFEDCEIHIALPVTYFDLYYKKIYFLLTKALEKNILLGFKMLVLGNSLALNSEIGGPSVTFRQNNDARIYNNPFTCYLPKKYDSGKIACLFQQIGTILKKVPGYSRKYLSIDDIMLTPHVSVLLEKNQKIETGKHQPVLIESIRSLINPKHSALPTKFKALESACKIKRADSQYLDVSSEKHSKLNEKIEEKIEKLSKECSSRINDEVKGFIQNASAAIENTYLKRFSEKGQTSAHLNCFSRIFDPHRGKRRATLYSNELSNSNHNFLTKTIILYALFASSDGKTLKNDIINKIHPLHSDKQNVFQLEKIRFVLLDFIIKSKGSLTKEKINKIVGRIVKYANGNHKKTKLPVDIFADIKRIEAALKKNNEDETSKNNAPVFRSSP